MKKTESTSTVLLKHHLKGLRLPARQSYRPTTWWRVGTGESRASDCRACCRARGN